MTLVLMKEKTVVKQLYRLNVEPRVIDQLSKLAARTGEPKTRIATREMWVLPAVSARLTSSITVGSSASSAIVVAPMPRALAHAGATWGSRTTRTEMKFRESPTATAWPMIGLDFASDSRFAGEMFLPADVMINSFLRSMIRNWPLGPGSAMSPLWTQPWASMISDVLPGSL